MSSENSLDALLATLEPMLHAGVFVYSTVPHAADLSRIETVMKFREHEGWTLILTEAEARRAGVPVLFRAAWITLRVHSDLSAVGLTAAVARALGDAGISCNVVAAAHHDHLFVPIGAGASALAALRELQARSVRGEGPAAAS